MKCKATKPDIASMRLNLPTMIIYQEVSVIRLTGSDIKLLDNSTLIDQCYISHNIYTKREITHSNSFTAFMKSNHQCKIN